MVNLAMNMVDNGNGSSDAHYKGKTNTIQKHKYNVKRTYKMSEKKKRVSFDSLNLSTDLISAIFWKFPTPIQIKALPVALLGYDVIVMARTGQEISKGMKSDLFIYHSRQNLSHLQLLLILVLLNHMNASIMLLP